MSDANSLAAATPFPLAPPSVTTTGPYLLAYQALDGMPVRVSADELAMHTLITGRTGGGKTALLTHLLLSVLGSVRPWILDLKDDTRFLAARHPGMLILERDTPFVPLKVPAYLSRAQHTSIFINTFAGALYGAESTKQVLTEALQHAYADHASPSLSDLKDAVTQLAKTNDTYARRDALRSTRQRLERLEEQYPGIARSRHGLGADTFCAHSLYFGPPLLTELEEFLFTYLVHHLFLYNRLRDQRTLTHLIVMDEGHGSWGSGERSSHRIGGLPLLTNLQPMTREFGIGFLVTTNSFLTTDPVLKSNTYLHACTRLAHADDTRAIARTYGLTEQQTAYLGQLAAGEVVLHRGNWPHPILATYPALTITKTVTQAAWQAAKERTTRLLPRDELPPTIARPTPAKEPNDGPTTIAPNKNPAAAPVVPIALSAAEEALLRAACSRLGPATTTYQAAGLHVQTADRAKKKLVAMGLLTEERVVIHSRRGGTATALVPTNAGYERLGIRRPHGTRGGDSAQHRYLVQELTRHLPGVTAETTVGGKSVDLLLRYQEPQHRPLGIALNTNASPPVTLTPGQVLAIEVEVSSPDKTIPANARKNHEAGIPLTVIAVLPSTMETARRALEKVTPGLRSTCTLIDALRLLDHLRAAPEQKD